MAAGGTCMEVGKRWGREGSERTIGECGETERGRMKEVERENEGKDLAFNVISRR